MLQYATALYDYEPQNWDELALQEGDLLEVVTEDDMEEPEAGWIRVRSSARPESQGIVPLAYVEVQTPLPNKPPAVDKSSKPQPRTIGFFGFRRSSKTRDQLPEEFVIPPEDKPLTRSKSTDTLPSEEENVDNVVRKRRNSFFKSKPSKPIPMTPDELASEEATKKKEKGSTFVLTAMLNKKRNAGALPTDFEDPSTPQSPALPPAVPPTSQKPPRRRSASMNQSELEEVMNGSGESAANSGTLRTWFKGYKGGKNTLTDVHHADLTMPPNTDSDALQDFEAEHGVGSASQDPARFRSWFVRYKESKTDLFAVDFERTVQQTRSERSDGSIDLSNAKKRPPGTFTGIAPGSPPGMSPLTMPTGGPLSPRPTTPNADTSIPLPSTAPPAVNQANPSGIKLWFDRIQNEREKEDLLASLTKEEKHFQQAAYEVYMTELDYVEDLRTIIEQFMRPIQERQLLKPKNIETLFSNLETLLGVNEFFLGELERVMDDTTRWPMINKISEAFLASMDYFPHYTEYCCNHPEAVELLKRKLDDRGFGKFLKENLTKKECRGLTLESFLIKPIQRICKYPLLIRELVRNCNEKHVDYAGLLKAAERMEAVVTEVNDRMKDAERIDKLQELASKIKSDEPLDILDPDRRLVMEGAVSSIENGKSAGERYLFLFNDKLLMTKPIRNLLGGDQFKLLLELPLTSLAVNDFLDPSGYEDRSATTSMFDLIKISRSQYAQNMAFRVEAGFDTNRWLGEFDKLQVKRNQKLEVVQSMSEKEDMLASLLGQVSGSVYEDPLETYRRQQEQNILKEREAQEAIRRQKEEAIRRQQEEARRQAEESKRQAEEAARRKMEEAQRQMEDAKRQEGRAQAEEAAKKKMIEAQRQMDDAKRQAEDRLRSENERLRLENDRLKVEKSELDLALAFKPLPTPPLLRSGGSSERLGSDSAMAIAAMTMSEEDRMHTQRLQAIRSNIAKSSGPKPKPTVPRRSYYHTEVNASAQPTETALSPSLSFSKSGQRPTISRPLAAGTSLSLSSSPQNKPPLPSRPNPAMRSKEERRTSTAIDSLDLATNPSGKTSFTVIPSKSSGGVIAPLPSTSDGQARSASSASQIGRIRPDVPASSPPRSRKDMPVPPPPIRSDPPQMHSEGSMNGRSAPRVIYDESSSTETKKQPPPRPAPLLRGPSAPAMSSATEREAAERASRQAQQEWIQADKARMAAEDATMRAEIARKEAMEARREAEKAIAEADIKNEDRVAADRAKKEAEQRAATERARREAEQLRKEREMEEKARKDSEERRREIELQRISAEKAKKEAIEKREEAERIRRAAEEDLKEAEQLKREAQELKAAAERAKFQLEHDRIQAERQKQMADERSALDRQKRLEQEKQSADRAKKEAEDRARKESEERARIERERQKQQQTTDKNKREEEEKARRSVQDAKDAAERAKREMDEARAAADRARREAEERRREIDERRRTEERVAADRERVKRDLAAEKEKFEAEKARLAAEKARREAEDARVALERAKRDAEDARNRAVLDKQKKEAEEAKAAAEKAKREAEEAKIAAEKARRDVELMSNAASSPPSPSLSSSSSSSNVAVKPLPKSTLSLMGASNAQLKK